MKYILSVTVLCLFMSGCASAKDSGSPSETALPEETVYQYDGEPLMFRPQDENAVYLIDDNLTLRFSGRQEARDFCEAESCMVYSSILLHGLQETELTDFGTRQIPVNSDTGHLILQKMNSMYFLSFSSGIAPEDTCAVIFDGQGNILQSFSDVMITMNTVYPDRFLVTYPHGKSGSNCVADQNCRYEEVWYVLEEGFEHEEFSPGSGNDTAPDSLKLWSDTLTAEYPDLVSDGYAAGESNFSESIELDGKTCRIAYFGTIQPNGMFTRERTFAVAEDCSAVYEYNTAEDTWYYNTH